MPSVSETRQKFEEDNKLLEEQNKYNAEIKRIIEKESAYRKNKLEDLSIDETRLLKEHRSQAKKTIDTGKKITDEDILKKQNLQNNIELNFLKQKQQNNTITELEKKRLQELLDLKNPKKEVGKLSPDRMINIAPRKTQLSTIYEEKATPIIRTTVNDDSNIVRITKISDNKYKTNINDKEKGNVTNIVNISETNDNKITVEIEEPESLIGQSRKMDDLLLNEIKSLKKTSNKGGKKSKKRQTKYKRNTKKSKK